MLEDCPSERGLYNALGFSVLLTALIGGFTMTVALSYVLGVSAARLWPAGLTWAVVIFNIDRLLQMMAAGKRMYLTLLPRLLISLILGVGIAEPLVLLFNYREIDNQIQHTVQQQVQQTQTNISKYYGPQIAAAQRQIAGIQSQEATLQAQINQNDFLATCEATDPSCSTTHEEGCGPYCRHYQQLAATAQAELNDEKPGDTATIQQLESQIKSLKASEDREIVKGRGTITTGNGFIAREEALSQIIRAHPIVDYEVWFLRIALITLDLLPLIVRYIHVASGEAAYERVNLALRRKEGSKAHQVDADTRVDISRINEQARTDEDVNRATIQVDGERRIAYAEGSSYGPVVGTSASRGAHVKSVNFSDFNRTSQQHESLPVPIPNWLRAAGWTGTALIAFLSVALSVNTYYSRRVVAGEWLVFVMLLVAVSLTAFTRGYRIAPRWALRATFGTLLAGMVLPIIVLALNL